jgi:hypothetical protein
LRVAAAALAFATAGCMPVVMHDPRIGEGRRVPIAVAAGIVPETVNDDPSILPYLTLGYAYGWVGETAAFSAGVQVPLFPYLPAIYYGAALDMYVQPSVVHARGGGFLLSPSFALPYVQLGTGQEGETSWFTTQGVALTYEEFEEGTFWVPSFALRHEREDGGRAVTLFANAGVPFDVDSWFGIVGFIMEFAEARGR